MSDFLEERGDIVPSSGNNDETDSSPHAAPSDLPRTVLAGIVYELDKSTIFRINDHDAAELAVVVERLGISRRDVESARNEIARAAQVESMTMPIAVTFHDRKIEVGVLAPTDCDTSALLKKVGEVCQLIVDRFHAGGELAQARSAGPTVRSDDEPTSTPPPSVDGEDEKKLRRYEPARIKKVALAYSAPRTTGDVKVSFVAAGQPDARPPLVISTAPAPGPAAFSLVPHEPIIAVVHKIGGPGRCFLREIGSRKLVSAEFSTSSDLSLLLDLVEGGHGVKLGVRAYKSDNVDILPAHVFLIDELIALTEEWCNEPRLLDDRQCALDKLKGLLPPSPPPEKGGKKKQR